MNSYNGLAVTTSGINIVAIINAKAILIPFVVKRENPYAAIAQSTVLITSVRPTINTVFPTLIKVLRSRSETYSFPVSDDPADNQSVF